ncbi:MAG: TIGR02587 family membrane protein [Pseudomonadota bacterium]|nr:TIGR02587 family membrane protein [Pseudomonadota bacterium]
MAGARSHAVSKKTDSTGFPHFLHALMWAFGGALLFALPTLMTMEMWSFSHHIHAGRFALFTVAVLAMLVGLSHYAGFEETFEIAEDVVDTFIAFLVGAVTAAVVLVVLAVFKDENWNGIVGAIGLQALPCSMGALLGRHLLSTGGEDSESRLQRNARYPGQLLLMTVGAMFLAFSLASTEEMVLLAYKMTAWHTLALMALTLLLMHGFVGGHVYRERESQGATHFSVFARFTIVGYALALSISAYVLWTFGRLDGLALEPAIQAVVVLGLPAAIGASASRMIL